MDVYYQVKNRLYKFGHLANNAPSLKRNLSRLTANQRARTIVANDMIKSSISEMYKNNIPRVSRYTVSLHTGFPAFSGF